MKILFIEDDRGLNESLTQYLSRELFIVTSVFSYSEGLKQNPSHFDLVILDWNLSDGQGIDLLKKWRFKQITTPVIFLTAKADLTDKVVSLESGANDYLTKPFEPRELLARIRVQLRHQIKSTDHFSIGPLRIISSERKAFYNSGELVLSKTEFDLLSFLARSPDQVFSREELLKEVWGYDRSPTTRTVDTHILQLRQKLTSELFETVHGIGYRLRSFK